MFQAYKRYFDFQGRSARPEYWLFALWLAILYLGAMLLDRMIFHSPVGLFYGVVVLANLIPSLAVGFRRLHDTNRSAWWVLISLVPLVGGIVLIVFNCLPGTPGPNRFGSVPGVREHDLQETFA
ncbi:MAG: DUF805 domain-containing protein [Caulobacterales bacterium]|nr:DUF805 domain-containing protein [Caulobacterales bacterium]